MVVPLRPGKFYGSSLPRPRLYTDVKFNDERIDPPVSVLDPLMSWAYEAHWSMGGLSFNRLRLQGKIEGNVKKLRKEREKNFLMKKSQNSTPTKESKRIIGTRSRKSADWIDTPPPAPISKKNRKRAIEDEEEYEDEEEEEEEEEEIEMEIKKEVRQKGEMKRKRRRLVRKLGDDFELVASENRKRGSSPLKDMGNETTVSNGVALRTRSRRHMVLMEEEGEDGNGGNKSKKSKKAEVEIGRKGSVSPTGSRSTPRLNKRLN